MPNIKTGKRRDIKVIFGKFKSLEDKIGIVTCLLPLSKGRKRGEEGKEREVTVGWIFWFLERECLPSL